MQIRFLSSWTMRLVAINFSIFILFNLISVVISTIQLQPFEQVFSNLIKFIALQPSTFLSMPWTIITSMFMHGGSFHILANMFSLLFIGGFLERIIGKKRFIWIYIISGLAGSLLYILNFYLTGTGDIMAVGASGAIFGLGGMLAIITPKMPVYIMFIPIAMPMWIGIILSLTLLWFLSITAGLPIGNLAHLGGLIVGVGYALYLRKKYKRRFDMISHYFR